MKFKKIIATVLIFTVFLSLTSSAETTEKSAEIQPTTWAAVDGLGRTLSLNSRVGDQKQDKTVAMFYWTWHYPWLDGFAPRTTGSVLDEYPEAVNDWYHPAWGVEPDGRPYFWDEPLYGFYSNLDEYVVRKHAELLADAGVDVVFFDTTNEDKLFDEGYMTLLRVWSEAKAQGVDVPQISFILSFGKDEHVHNQLVSLYDNLYSKGIYSDMYFMWDGKPMLMADSSVLNIFDKKDKAIFDFFTFRKCETTYFANNTSYLEDTWGWCSEYPQTRFGTRPFGKTEQICVSVAQNANEDGLSAMNNPNGTVQGRGYAKGDYSYSYTYAGEEIVVDMNIENSLLYGLNFQQQWDYAIERNPDIVFVTGFNEWIAGRFLEWYGTENAFPDQFNPAYSRDIEPSRGVLKDHYYYQLVENIRRYKGADALPATDADKTIDINGDLSQWDNVLPEYNHYEGGKHRDSIGWKGTYYINDTFRNDIIQAKVAYDEENVYFYVKTADDLTPESDPDWMRLLIDTDTSGMSSNWEGFEFVVNRLSPKDGVATLESCKDNLVFEKVCDVDYCVSGNTLQIEIPRESLGLTGEEVKFNFKWSDNLLGADAMSFYENGDAAPGGRFAFVFDSTVTDSADNQDSDEPSPIKIFFEEIEAKIEAFKADIRKFLNYIFG